MLASDARLSTSRDDKIRTVSDSGIWSFMPTLLSRRDDAIVTQLQAVLNTISGMIIIFLLQRITRFLLTATIS